MKHSPYACVCFALPRKLLQHMADTSEDEHREVLLAQIDHSSRLRAQRASQTRKRVAGERGRELLHRQVFSAQGQTFLPGKLLRDEDDPPVHADREANQAYDNVGIALQFFRSVLGRDSVDGKGMRIDASVHYGFRFANAMWTGEQVIVGEGDGRNVANLAGSLGLIAHELSHGVTQHIVRGGLGVDLKPGQPPALKGEAGALNESFCDVFASMIKQWHAGETVAQADWLIGEDVLLPKVGKAVRSLEDPGNTQVTWQQDDQILDFRKYRPTDEPHKASGIASHAFYLAAMQTGGIVWK